MLERWLPLCLLIGACASAPSGTIVIPTVAYPFAGETLLREDVRACANRVEAPGNFERAAFLVIDDSGTFDCQLWPAGFQVRRAAWAGTIPEGTVAVIHSHPREHPDPSAHDQQEALRIRVPIIVVTPGALTMAMPGGGAAIRVIRMNGGGFRVAYTARNEAARNHHPHTRQARPLPHERSRAHPQTAGR